MCQYRAWEDDLPESEEGQQQNFEERRYGTTAILDQLEECMNEMRSIIESMKEINARLKKINYYLLAFLSVICMIEILKYLR